MIVTIFMNFIKLLNFSSDERFFDTKFLQYFNCKKQMLILYCINVVSEKIYHVFVWLADPVGKPIQLNPVVEPFQLDPVGEPIHLASSWIQLAQ